MRVLLIVLVALSLCGPAFAQDETAVRFRQGMIAIKASQKPGLSEAARDILHDKAIAAFREMLVADPTLVRVRLELARAFFLKGEDRLARQHFERVLAGGVPQAVAHNVRRYLATIRARRRWDLHAGFALAPDTNIGGASDQRIIYIYGLPFERDAEDLATSGIGLSVWTGGEYQHPLRDRLRLRAGASGSRREYSGKPVRPYLRVRARRAALADRPGAPRRAFWRARSGAGARARRTTTPSGSVSRPAAGSPRG